ncbi:hypothetical protein [uncultured Clostridium sp.]|uniref:hypothetical protein n=1 Tax=uncultured Clostridium sp. TaxID=59620 RepID=UPI0025CDD022|nr:hypothetical protein [uncultured Clostridium sp.]
MTKEEKILLNYVVQERMDAHYTKFKETYGKSDRERYNAQAIVFNKIAEKLSHEDRIKINRCLDTMTNLIIQDNERYYRAGVEDGLRLDKMIKQIKEKED